MSAIFNTGTCQDPVNISGQVQDVDNGKPLPYAQIAWTGTNVGTVTNEEGRFILAIPDLFRLDSITIIFMGYYPGRFSAREMAGKNGLIFKLKPKVLQLNEVEVVAYSPEEVIRKCVERIPENYGTTPLILTAFIRSRKYVNGTMAEFTEALLKDKKTGYTLYPEKRTDDRKRDSNIPELVRGRVMADTALVNKMGDIGRNAGCLGCNFIHDFAEFYHQTVLDEELFKDYSFTMKEIPGEDGKIYRINFDQKKGVKKKLWRGEIWIDGKDFALVRLTQRPSFEAWETYEKGKLREQFYLDHQYGWIKEMPKMEWTTTYSKREGYYYLSTIIVENWLTFSNLQSGKQIRFSHKNEVVITDATRDPEKIRTFTGDKSTGVGQRWDQIVGKEEVQFWRNMNYLPLEESLQDAVMKMGKR